MLLPNGNVSFAKLIVQFRRLPMLTRKCWFWFCFLTVSLHFLVAMEIMAFKMDSSANGHIFSITLCIAVGLVFAGLQSVGPLKMTPTFLQGAMFFVIMSVSIALTLYIGLHLPKPMDFSSINLR